MTDPESREFRVLPDMVGRLRRRGAAIVADNATVVADVRLGKDVNVWFGVTIRGDDAPIEIGDCSGATESETRGDGERVYPPGGCGYRTGAAIG